MLFLPQNVINKHNATFEMLEMNDTVLKHSQDSGKGEKRHKRFCHVLYIQLDHFSGQIK